MILRTHAGGGGENGTVKSVVRLGIQPNPLPLLFDFKTKFATISNIELALQASPTRLFLRLKLGFPCWRGRSVCLIPSSIADLSAKAHGDVRPVPLRSRSPAELVSARVLQT